MLSDSSKNDHHIVLARLKQGDKDVLSILYDRYWDGLMRSCYKVTRDFGESEDLVQEVFLLVWESRADIQIEKDLGAYLFGVLKFKIFNYLKSNRRRCAAFDQMADISSHKQYADPTPESLLEHKELYLSVRRIVSTLPDRCRMIYQMRDEDMSYQDIAEALDVSVKTVDSQLLKARNHLRASLRQFLGLLPFFIAIIC